MGVKDTQFIADLLKSIGQAKQQSARAKVKYWEILRKKERILNGSGESFGPGEDELTDLEQAYFNYQGCQFDSPLDPNGSDLNVRYYFPKQRVLLSFDDTDSSGLDRELGEITIYKRAEEKVGGVQ